MNALWYLLLAVLVVGALAAVYGILFVSRYRKYRAAVLSAIDSGHSTSREIRDAVNGGGWIYVVLSEMVKEGALTRTEEPGGPERGYRPRFRYALVWGEE